QQVHVDRPQRGGHRPGEDLLRRPLRQEARSEEHTSELQSRFDLVCRLLLEKKNCACTASATPSPATSHRPREQPSSRRPCMSAFLPFTSSPTTPALFPYTTLFRSQQVHVDRPQRGGHRPGEDLLRRPLRQEA